MTRKIVAVLCCFAACCVGLPALAQVGSGTDNPFQADDVNPAGGDVPTTSTEFYGRISTKTSDGTVPIARMRMTLLRDGRIIRTTQTSAEGEFTFVGMAPGAYSLAGSSAEGFLATGINLTAQESDDGYSIDALAIPPRFRTLARIIRDRVRRSQSADVGGYRSALARGLIARDQPVTSDVSLVSKQSASLVNAAMAGSMQVYLDATGSFQGVARVFGSDDTDFSSTAAFLIQNDQEVATVSLSSDGAFEFNNVSPGVYGLVVAGSAGFGAVQIVLQASGGDGEAEARRTLASAQFVAHRLNQPLGVEMSLMNNQDAETFLEEEEEEEEEGAPAGGPVAGGTGPGPAGGAPGEGGGFNPLGLAGLAGLAGLIDDDNRVSPD